MSQRGLGNEVRVSWAIAEFVIAESILIFRRPLGLERNFKRALHCRIGSEAKAYIFVRLSPFRALSELEKKFHERNNK